MPRIQERPNHGLHWFDPFGSVRFEDLCNVPPVDNDNRAVRYLFIDQEPVHTDQVDQTVKQFVEMFYSGQRHLITSEYDSEYVDHIVNTYNFQAHYYWFHGWAALDWFRGYNRSFLMKPYNERQITHTFTAPNRIVAGERKHRLVMLYHIFKLGMTRNHISCPAVCPVENITVHEAIKTLEPEYPDIREVFSNTCFPKSFVGEANAPMRSYQLDLFQECAESLLYLVTETVATGRRNHLTEKTFKPIALKMPFIIVSTQGSLEYLRSYGFRTFDHIWDESYDTITNDHERYAAIAATLRDLNQLPQRCKQGLFRAAEAICEHNYNHFYSGGFEQVLWAELTDMLAEL